MRSTRFLSALVLTFAAACGDDGNTPPTNADSGPHDDAAPDAPPLPVGCDYAETRDADNDDLYLETGTPELTGLTFTSSTTVCGTFDETHFDAAEGVVDVDTYVFELATAADVMVTIHGPGAEAIELAGVELYTGTDFADFIASADIATSHGVAAVHLEPGTYELLTFALNSAALTAPVSYKIKITTDAPETRCPDLTTGGYTEANDGVTSTGNDVVTITFGAGGSQALTTVPTDSPDNSAAPFAIEPTTIQRITGSLADIATPDSYEDKDTYAFTTGANTNQLAVRLTWPGTTYDLDYFLFEAGMVPAVTRVTNAGTTGPEFRTFVVKPSTSYWLLVGADATSTGLPVAYNATVCGAQFTP